MKEPNFERMLQIIEELGLEYVPARLAKHVRRQWSKHTIASPAVFLLPKNVIRVGPYELATLKEFYLLIGDMPTYANRPYQTPPRVRDAEVAAFFKARHNLMS